VKSRPGLCDVPHLRDKVVVSTNRIPPSAYYGSWKIGEVKLDVRQLLARDVVGIAISAERQNQQNVLKLKALSAANWAALVDLVYTQGLQASDTAIGQLLGYQGAQIQNTPPRSQPPEAICSASLRSCTILTACYWLVR